MSSPTPPAPPPPDDDAEAGPVTVRALGRIAKTFEDGRKSLDRAIDALVSERKWSRRLRNTIGFAAWVGAFLGAAGVALVLFVVLPAVHDARAFSRDAKASSEVALAAQANADHASCVRGNDSRAGLLAMTDQFDKLAAQGEAARGLPRSQETADFLAFLRTTFALRDCTITSPGEAPPPTTTLPPAKP